MKRKIRDQEKEEEKGLAEFFNVVLKKDEEYIISKSIMTDDRCIGAVIMIFYDKDRNIKKRVYMVKIKDREILDIDIPKEVAKIADEFYKSVV